jgi:predicted transcriptional regulator
MVWYTEFMKDDEDGMSKTAAITGRVSQRVKDRLAEIAKTEQRDEDELVGSLLEASVESLDFRARIIRERLVQADAGGPFVDGEDVKRWLKSWGEENELPVPEATIRF